MKIDTNELVEIIAKGSDENGFKASDSLGKIGTEEDLNKLINLLNGSNEDVKFLAARTLGLMKENASALEPLLEAINDKNNETIAGDLLMVLDGFDISEHYVPIFKLYLFGSFKVSKIAKELLDYKEFNVTQRVLKKATKHWNHYQNNVKHDDAFKLFELEVKERLEDLELFLNGNH